MKKSKLTLGLVTGLVSIGALAACNEVTYSDGVVLEYTDAAGQVTRLTAEEFFGEQYSTSVASTDFDSVQEVLIRKYFESGSGRTSLPELKKKASQDVQSAKDQAETNANNNKTSYAEEFEKILKNNGVENVDELYNLKLYQQEKARFEELYETPATIEAMRDGTAMEGKAKPVFAESDDYGRGNDGYLAEQLPYTISHVLIKTNSAANGEHCQATISEDESRKIGQVIEAMAGANLNNPSQAAVTRIGFGDIALQKSDDTGSAAKYGSLGIMDRDQADQFINEFKFGIYAYEAIYNQVNQSEATNPYAAKQTLHDGTGETYALTSKIRYSANATYTDKSKVQTAEEETELNEGEHYIRNLFAAGGDYAGIGVIPYGAAVALAKDDVAKNEFEDVENPGVKMNWKVNGDSATFYPRNILFNKYFNDHRVAVIVPNEIAYNDNSIAHPTGLAGDYTTEDFRGVLSDTYKQLPGFQTDTKTYLPASILGQDSNVLTTERGQIILVVRGGSNGSYEGIHFMVIDRSALDQYVEMTETGPKSISEADYEAKKDTADVNSLSEWYTIYHPEQSAYPTYENGNQTSKKSTFVNQITAEDFDYKSSAEAISSKVASYNKQKDTYMFQALIEDDSITFGTSSVAKRAEELIKIWIKSKREQSHIDSIENFDDSWATYIEFLTAQDEARALNADGSQRLISETCAIGYNQRNSNQDNKQDIWAIGGACYAK